MGANATGFQTTIAVSLYTRMGICMEIKQCRTCGQEYPATTEYFYPARNKSGIGLDCRACFLARLRQKDHERANHLRHLKNMTPDERAAYNQAEQMARLQRNEESHQRKLEVLNRRAVKNREYHRRKAREYYHAHKDRIKASASTEKGKRLAIIWHNRRRARKQALPDTWTLLHWKLALEYWYGCCAVCGRQLRDLFGTHKPAADHWIPLTSPDCPGTIPTNMIPLCHGEGGCNNSKGAKMPEEWLSERYSKQKVHEILNHIELYFEWIDRHPGG